MYLFLKFVIIRPIVVFKENIMVHKKNNAKDLYLYEKIIEELLERISNGIYSEGDKLPTEISLQKEFDVSRITARRALNELENRGIISRYKGKGSIVNPNKTYVNLVGVQSFTKSIDRTGNRPSSIIIDFSSTTADKTIAECLQLEEGDLVYHLKRLRLRNGRIIGLNDTYIQYEIGKLIDKNLVDETFSLYQTYSELGILLKFADEQIECMIPTNNIRCELYLEEGQPVFYRERITYDNNNRPIEFSKNTYRADSYKYVLRLQNENGF